jgi:DNA-binding GntR family transcriptional regulator
VSTPVDPMPVFAQWDRGGPTDGDVRISTVTRSVANHIRRQIQDGTLPPGSRLRQQHIASTLGISTTPVREALRLLQAEGIVTLGEHRGAEVFRPTVEDVREYYEMREVLESLAVTKAVPNLTPAALADLRAVVDEMEQTEDHERFLQLNHRFHSTIYELSGRPQLCATIANLNQRTSGYARFVLGTARRSGRADHEHRQILEACARGDAAAAAEALQVHLHETVEATVRYLEEGVRP